MRTRAIVPSLAIPGVLAVIVAFGAVSPAPLRAQASGPAAGPVIDSIHVKRRFFGMKYTVGGGREDHVIDPWVGLSLRKSFTDVLARDSSALAQARKASPFLAMGFAGTMGTAVGAALMVSDVLNDAERGYGGRSVTDGTGFRLMIASGVVSIVGGIMARSHIGRAIDLYNDGRASAVAFDASRRFNAQPLVGLSRAGTSPVVMTGVTMSIR